MNIKKRKNLTLWLLLVLFMSVTMLILLSGSVTAEINSPTGPNDWGNEIHISTNSPNGAYVPVIDIAPNGDLIIAYRHRTASAFNLPYYSESSSNGNDWSNTPAPVRGGTTDIPQVVAAYDNANVVHAVWRTDTDIFHSPRSNWPAAGTPIVATVGSVLDPDMDTADNGTLHVVWAQKDSGPGLQENIYHAYSTNGGAGWIVSPALATDTRRSVAPAVSIDNNGNVHVVWEERIFNISQGAFITEIRYKKGTFVGNNLTFDATPKTISDPNLNSYRPDIVATDDGRVHVAFMTQVTEDEQYAMYAQYNGSSWQTPVDTTNNNPVGVNQSDPFFLIVTIDACDGIVYVYYHGALSPTSKEQILGSNSGDGWAFREQVTPTDARSINPSLVCRGSQLYLAFDRIEESGPNAGTAQVYFIGDTGGGIFMPIMLKN